MSPIRKNRQRKALIQTCLVIVLLLSGGGGFVFWASTAQNSPLAESFRRVVGIPEPKAESAPAPAPPPEPGAVAEAPVAPEPEPEPVPEVVAEPEPAPLPDITYAEIRRRSDLWPDALSLELSKRVYIRYNGNVYGHMQFSRGMTVDVDGLGPKGEVFGWIDGNFLSLSVAETNFEAWFRSTHGERYNLLPVEAEPGRSDPTVRHQIGTPAGDAEFWTEMRIWCARNYDSISLEIKEDTLVFRWLPKEATYIDYPMEAREIARNFLLKRAARGGNENYAACEIRHPVTDELLGASSIFIPRL